MKINSITLNTINHPQSKPSGGLRERGRECEKERHNLNQYNNDQINTTIRMNSDGRASFKGGVPLLHKMANFASDNPLVAESLFAIFITCGLRPLSIMATAKTKEDKDKCSYQAAKSISSGVVGLATTAIIGMPIAAATKLANKKGAFEIPPDIKEKSSKVVKQGIDALTDFAKKLDVKDIELAEQIKKLTDGGKINLSVLQKAGKGAEQTFKNKIAEKAPEISDKVTNAISQQKVINNYSKTAKNIMDKLFQPGFMPLRATITVALVPVILGLFGKKKPSGTKQENNQSINNNFNYNVFQNNTEKQLFQSFAGVTNYENK